MKEWMDRALTAMERWKQRCVRCNESWYAHRDHTHKPYPTCPFGDCDEFQEVKA